MKRFTLVLVLSCLAGILITEEAYAPALVSKEGTVYLKTSYETVPSTSYQFIRTPSRNKLLKLTWQLSAGNPLIPEKGVNKISVGGSMARDTETLVYPDGRVKGVFHVNGSGNITPNPGKK